MNLVQKLKWSLVVGLTAFNVQAANLNGFWQHATEGWNIRFRHVGAQLTGSVGSPGAGQASYQLAQSGPDYFTGTAIQTVPGGCTVQFYAEFQVVNARHIAVTLNGSNGNCGFSPNFYSTYSFVR